MQQGLVIHVLSHRIASSHYLKTLGGMSTNLAQIFLRAVPHHLHFPGTISQHPHLPPPDRTQPLFCQRLVRGVLASLLQPHDRPGLPGRGFACRGQDEVLGLRVRMKGLACRKVRYVMLGVIHDLFVSRIFGRVPARWLIASSSPPSPGFAGQLAW